MDAERFDTLSRTLAVDHCPDFAMPSGRPQPVTADGDRSATFLNLQHGECDVVRQD